MMNLEWWNDDLVPPEEGEFDHGNHLTKLQSLVWTPWKGCYEPVA